MTEKPKEKTGVSWNHGQNLNFEPLKKTLLTARESVKVMMEGLQKEVERHKAVISRMRR